MDASPAKKKRTRKSILLDTKVKILDMYKTGKSSKEITCTLGVDASTVSSVVKRADVIEEMASSLSKHANYVTKKRCHLIEKMESSLVDWIKERRSRNELVEAKAIRERARLFHRELYESLDEARRGQVKRFTASNGWFDHFKKRFGYRLINKTGEATYGDGEAAREFVASLAAIIRDGDYDPRQVFNVDEMGIRWRYFASTQRHYVNERTGEIDALKFWTDWLKLLVGCNARGDKRLKPLLSFKTANPKSLAGVDLNSLPVIWKPSKQGRPTKRVVHEWFYEYFVPEMKDYCERENMFFKILLLIDDALTFDIDFEGLCPNVKVIVLRPEVSSFLQPMKQGITSILRTYYDVNVGNYIKQKCEGDGALSLKESWKSFNMAECIYNIALSWDEVPQECLNSLWKNVYPEAVYSKFDFKKEKSKKCPPAESPPYQNVFEDLAPAIEYPTKKKAQKKECDNSSNNEGDDFEWPIEMVETKPKIEDCYLASAKKSNKKSDKKKKKKKTHKKDRPLSYYCKKEVVTKQEQCSDSSSDADVPLDMSVYPEKWDSPPQMATNESNNSLVQTLNEIIFHGEHLLNVAEMMPNRLGHLEMFTNELKLIELNVTKCYDDVNSGIY